MDPFESLDDAAAEMNDPEFSAAVAEFSACYKEMLGPISSSKSDSEAIFNRLNKAAAIGRKKMAERDAKRAAESGLDKIAFEKKMKNERDAKVAEFKNVLKDTAQRASNGDEAAQCLVELQREVERANGEKMEEFYKKMFY